jgi:hypothetical protein
MDERVGFEPGRSCSIPSQSSIAKRESSLPLSGFCWLCSAPDDCDFHSINNSLGHELGSENSYHLACNVAISFKVPW